MRLRGLMTALVVTGWWLAFGIASFLQFSQMGKAEGLAPSWSLAIAPMSSALLWIPPTWLALIAARKAPIGAAPWKKALAVHLAATLAVVIFRAVTVIALNDLVHWYSEMPMYGVVFIKSLQNNLFLYWLVTAAAHAVVYAQDSRLRERQLAEARLHALASQLQPHFLFNALNTVAALVHENPHAAEKVIIRLSSLLRETVGVTGSELVPLGEEVVLLEAYLDVEQARFEDRLNFSWDVPPEARGALVPRFVLQPIVENAIIHGLRHSPGPLSIVIIARVADGRLTITITDTGPGFDPSAAKEGFGLSSTRARLAAAFNPGAELLVQSSPGNGTTVQLIAPYLSGQGTARSDGASG